MMNHLLGKLNRWLTLVMLICCGYLPVCFAQQPPALQPIPILLADPTLFLDKGTYYLYGTGSSAQAGGFVSYTSTDLKTWNGPVGAQDGFAFKKGDAWGTAQFWAPQVFQRGNRYYIAYAANEHIGLAVSDHPNGPFRMDSAKPLSVATKQIDPYVFEDSDGKLYLYYVVVANGGNRIYVATMNDSLTTVDWSSAKVCIEAAERWENTDSAAWTVAEGPTVVKHRNLYYLVYSANDFRNRDYAVGFATSSSPMGPWKKHAGNPVIHRSVTGQSGSGHGDMIKDGQGNWWYVFHTHNSADKVGPRRTALIRLRFERDAKAGFDRLTAEPTTFRFLFQEWPPGAKK